jgi:hypothetical protein
MIFLLHGQRVQERRASICWTGSARQFQGRLPLWDGVGHFRPCNVPLLFPDSDSVVQSLRAGHEVEMAPFYFRVSSEQQTTETNSQTSSKSRRSVEGSPVWDAICAK